MEPVRLQKYLSQMGVASRRKAEELIAAGAVQINGRTAQIGMSVDPKRDLITVDGVRVQPRAKGQGYHYIMLHKPRGYVTTLQDEQGRRCVADLLSELPDRVYPIGRLDKDSEGLLLLTDDGEFANQLMHPRYHIPKVYRVTVRPDFTEENAIALLEGLEVDGERFAPVPTRVRTREPGRAVVEMALHEGKNRQIRRMCEAMGLEVARLRRIAVGPVRLGMLQPGKWRELEKRELDALRRDLQKNIARVQNGQKPEEFSWGENDDAKGSVSEKAPRTASGNRGNAPAGRDFAPANRGSRGNELRSYGKPQTQRPPRRDSDRPPHRDGDRPASNGSRRRAPGSSR